MLITAASAADIDVPVIDPAQFGITATPEVMHALAASMTTTVSQTLRAQYEAKYEAEIAQRIQAEVRQRVEAELANRVQAIYEQLLLSRRRMFGRSSETHAGQGRLFDEADALAQTTTEADEQAQLPLSSTVAAEQANDKGQNRKKARGKRGPLPAALPRIDIIHDVPEAQRNCACGTTMVLIGEDVSEQLDVIPMQIRVLRHIRKRYGCPSADQAPVSAPIPLQVLPKSNASNDLLAMLLTAKYVDGLPLARNSNRP